MTLWPGFLGCVWGLGAQASGNWFPYDRASCASCAKLVREALWFTQGLEAPWGERALCVSCARARIPGLSVQGQ